MNIVIMMKMMMREMPEIPEYREYCNYNENDDEGGSLWWGLPG